MDNQEILRILDANAIYKLEDAYKQGRADAFVEAIEYFMEHAHEVYEHVSARDFICDSLEQLKENNDNT